MKLRSVGAPPPRIVFDTNIVLSALLFSGATGVRLRRAWHRAEVRPLVSSATAQELVHALTYPKFGLSPAGQHELLGDYLPCTEVIHAPLPHRGLPDCRDPFDLVFLALADAGKARALVTGDRDLLAVIGFGIPIVTQAAFQTEWLAPR